MRAHLPLPASVSAARLLWLLLAVAALATAGLLLHAEQADATHDPDATLHVCIKQNGTLKADNTCGQNETAKVLATGAGLDAAEDRIAELETQVADLEGANADLEDRVATLEDDLAAATDRIATLESDLAAATDRIATLEDGQGDLDGRVGGLETTLAGVTRTTVDDHDTLRFESMNLQLVNGTGTTDGDPNGLGNLIVGYNEDLTCDPDTSGCPMFSDGAEDERTGSHMLVTGIDHTYTTFGGLLAGANNTTSGEYATVTGGAFNEASGDRASVSGGFSNTASDFRASVSGGAFNEASGPSASVSGGRANIASDGRASVSGGEENEAAGGVSSILGGSGQEVFGEAACHPSCE